MGQVGPELVVRSRGWFSRGGVLVHVCYTLADQEVKVEKNFRQLRQLEGASKLQALILMGDFSQSNINWKGNRDAGDLWS